MGVIARRTEASAATHTTARVPWHDAHVSRVKCHVAVQFLLNNEEEDTEDMRPDKRSSQDTPMGESRRVLSRAFRTPVSNETRQLLQIAWERLPQRLRTSHQFLGRQYAGCGATIGAMPRCDFACRGCYLGIEANHIPALSVEELKRQLRRIRAWLGEGGNVQLTDGEVMLRPEAEVIELLQYARAIGLVPMLMTHGDMFRRRPELLKRLMAEGGLTEVSIHIDTTQRGRRGQAYKQATREEALLPLRDEFAAIIRRVRRETGLTLDAATTFTVTRENLVGVPAGDRMVSMCEVNAEEVRERYYAVLRAHRGTTESL